MAHPLKFEVVSLKEVPWNDSTMIPDQRARVVLVVDDERVIADTLSMILRKSGYDVMTAYDGTTALALARAVPPSLLITDVVMPGMTGIELAIMLVNVIEDCKVLLFSGQAATVDLLAVAREMGHEFTILTKPVHPTDMLRRVSECIEARELVAAS
ncbi:MAG TPA: response regulator [Edaphobacter sp.]|jgi:CheY-like chemotaxis protein|nr:response regulator [Edaphobacter sp.]